MKTRREEILDIATQIMCAVINNQGNIAYMTGKEYVKLAKKEAEEGKIAVRKIRQDVNAKIKKAEKDKEISEDDMKKLEKQVQDLTDLTIKTIDDVLAKKEKEITTV